MKNNRYILPFFAYTAFIILLFGCSSDDNKSDGPASEIDGVWVKGGEDFTNGFIKRSIISINKGVYINFIDQDARRSKTWDTPNFYSAEVRTIEKKGTKYLTNGGTLTEKYELGEKGELKLGNQTFYPASQRIKNILNSMLTFQKDKSLTEALWKNIENGDEKASMQSINNGAWVDAGQKSTKKLRIMTLANRKKLSAKMIIALDQHSLYSIPVYSLSIDRPEILAELIEGKNLNSVPRNKMRTLFTKLLESNLVLATKLGEKYGTKAFDIEVLAYNGKMNPKVSETAKTLLGLSASGFSQADVSNNLIALSGYFTDAELAAMLKSSGYREGSKGAFHSAIYQLVGIKYVNTIAVLMRSFPELNTNKDLAMLVKTLTRISGEEPIEQLLLKQIEFSNLPDKTKIAIKNVLKGKRFESLREKLN